MMTVRFASGLSIQYNTACFAECRVDGAYTDLYTRNGGKWIAQVPTAACVIEAVPACRVYCPVGSDTVKASVDLLTKEVRAVKRKLAKMEGAR